MVAITEHSIRVPVLPQLHRIIAVCTINPFSFQSYRIGQSSSNLAIEIESHPTDIEAGTLVERVHRDWNRFVRASSIWKRKGNLRHRVDECETVWQSNQSATRKCEVYEATPDARTLGPVPCQIEFENALGNGTCEGVGTIGVIAQNLSGIQCSES